MSVIVVVESPDSREVLSAWGPFPHDYAAAYWMGALYGIEINVPYENSAETENGNVVRFMELRHPNKEV